MWYGRAALRGQIEFHFSFWSHSKQCHYNRPWVRHENEHPPAKISFQCIKYFCGERFCCKYFPSVAECGGCLIMFVVSVRNKNCAGYIIYQNFAGHLMWPSPDSLLNINKDYDKPRGMSSSYSKGWRQIWNKLQWPNQGRFAWWVDRYPHGS